MYQTIKRADKKLSTIYIIKHNKVKYSNIMKYDKVLNIITYYKI